MHRHTRVAIVLSLLLGVVFWWHMPIVFAETGGYPYADKPCIWAPYATDGAGAQWCPDYDFGDTPNNQSAANVLSSYGYYYRNCTDYTAWKVGAAGVDAGLYAGLGNAKDWAVRASAKGIRVDSTPAVGAVGVRTTGMYGHTAYIEAVHDDGSVTISHYNYGGDGNYSVQHGPSAAFGLTVFIHFEDYVPAPVLVTPAQVTPEPAPETAPEPPVTPEVALQAEAVPDPLSAPELAPEVPPEQVPEAPASVQATGPIAQTVSPAVTSPVPQPPAVPSMATPVLEVQSVTPTLQQATASPPSVTITNTKPLANTVRAVPRPTDPATYWPLLGLVGALLVQSAGNRRQKMQP